MTTNTRAFSLLTDWLHVHLGGIYGASKLEEEVFRTYFSDAFSENAIIHYNHELVSQEAFLKRLMDANFASTHASTSWPELMEIPSKDEGGGEGGIIAGTFTVTRTLKYRIRAGPAQRESENTFSAKVADLGTQGENGEKKLRIIDFFITSVDKAVPVHLHDIPAF